MPNTNFPGYGGDRPGGDGPLSGVEAAMVVVIIIVLLVLDATVL
jgi:hypothetical protein